MAYSDKLTATGFVDAYTQILRFITDDPNTAGRDWQIIYTELDNSPNNVQYISYLGSLDVTELNTWYYLPTCHITEYTFNIGGINLVENVDYTLDWKLGKIKFLTQTGTVDYSYKFKRFRIVLKNVGSGTDAIYIGLLLVSSGYGKANVIVRCYKAFDVGITPFLDTSVGNRRNNNRYDCAFGMWDSSMNAWIFSNSYRVIVTVRSNVYYSFAYAGWLIRYALPIEYRYPYAVVGDLGSNIDASDANWYDNTDNERNFLAKAYWGTGYARNNQIYTAEGSWVYGATTIPSTNNTDRWIQYYYYPNYPKICIPIYITYNSITYGTLEGVFWMPDNTTPSESIITVGSDQYIVFNNCWRNTWSDYMAIKCV